MELSEIHDYIINHKNKLNEFSKLNLSRCNKSYFQISLVKRNHTPYSLKNIHYEIIKTNDINKFVFAIHFEEDDTTRYKNDIRLVNLVNENNLEFFSWWIGKKKQPNINNESIKSRSDIELINENDISNFINYLYNIFTKFNNLLIEIHENKGKLVQTVKNNFKDWLKKNGHTQATLSTYPLMLSRDIPELLKTQENEFPNSIFEISDLEILEKIYSRCIKGDLKEFNKNTQNRTPSAAIRKYIEFIEKDSINFDLKTKNIMLYGAPGVGKTHNYKKLISMIENGNNEKNIFSTISMNENTSNEYDEIFKRIKNEKRIKFVTFHQSYSYEDFIEGFRPNDNGDIELDKEGIFKKICEDAEDNLEKSKINLEENNINIDELISKFRNFVQDSLDNNKDFILDRKVTIKGINDKNAFLLGGTIKSPQRLTPDIIKRDYNLFKNGVISKYEDIKPSRESKSLHHGNARYYYMIYKKISEFENRLMPSEIKQKNETRKNFYIVIDEINRGNISKIFGELITLIEEDKRGKKEYEVTLPYSKDPFLVPENLYIIATMNSTDKSIATIDIALRRRFTFLKMKPNSDLVKDTDAKKLMEGLNQYITESSLGEDYQLGHSYFMGDNIDLGFVIDYKIKPLLEEYYYADEKTPDQIIALVKTKYEIDVPI